MNRIRDLRIDRGWTQLQLGKRIGAAKSTVSGYESEDRQLTPALIHQLCDLFGCSADYLLGRSSSPLPVITDADARVLAAYHAASLRDRALVDQILEPYAAGDQSKTGS